MISASLLAEEDKKRKKFSVWKKIHFPPKTSPVSGRTKIFKYASRLGYRLWSSTIIEQDTDDPEEIEIWKNILWYSIPSLWYGYPSRVLPVRYHILEHNLNELCKFNERKETLPQVVPILSEILPLDIAKLIVEFITYEGIKEYAKTYGDYHFELTIFVDHEIKKHNKKNFGAYYPFEGTKWKRDAYFMP